MSEANMIIKNAKGVIFDLDGTLADSMNVWRELDVIYLEKYGYEVPADLHDEIEGMSFTETAVYFKERFNIPDTIDEIKKCWSRMAYDIYCNDVVLKPGVAEFLPYIKSLGCKIAIASSNVHTLIQAFLNAHHIAEYFDAIVTSCDVKAGKPAPDVYLKAADMINIEPKDCIVFEDVPAGIMAGKNAGMYVFAVADEFSKQHKNRKIELADGWIDDYRELM